MIILWIWIGISSKLHAHLIQFFSSVECIISKTFLYKTFGILSVHVLSFTLPVRSIFPRMLCAFIWYKSTPFQCIKNIFFSTGHKPALVCVFYSKNKIALVFFCKQIIIQ